MNSVFMMIKPDATERNLAEQIFDIFRSARFHIISSEERILTKEAAEFLYDEHKALDHFPDLVAYTISGPVYVSHLYLPSKLGRAVVIARSLVGDSNPAKRLPGTIRDKYALDRRRNSVHASDSDSAAIRELSYFFPI